jgi:beta-galactosidase
VLGLSVPEFLPLYADQVVTLDSGATGTGWSDDIVLEGAEAVARYTTGPAAGGPAVTRHRLGDGTAWYVSTRLAGGDLAAFVEEVLDEAGVVVPGGRVEGLEVVTRHGDDAVFTFFVNHADVDAQVDARAGVELLGGETVDGPLTVPAGGVRVVRSPRG